MELLRWLFEDDVQHFKQDMRQDISQVMYEAEETAGRIVVDAQQAANQLVGEANKVVNDATSTAVRVVDDAERRLVRAYVFAFCLIVGAGLVHFMLVRSQVRDLEAATAKPGAPAREPVATQADVEAPPAYERRRKPTREFKKKPARELRETGGDDHEQEAEGLELR